jgi:adenylate kinase
VRLLIMGAPGAGKGTQATALAERYGVPAISTGDIFRANIKGGTELGKKVQDILAAGQYVPDEVTNEIVADRLTHEDAQGGFLLDGPPRATGSTPCSNCRCPPTRSSTGSSSGRRSKGVPMTPKR